VTGRTLGRSRTVVSVGARGKEFAFVVVTLSIVLMITSSLLVLLVLLHKGKGGGLSDLFGGGFTSSFGSSSVVERNLDRFTIGCGIIWLASILGLLFLLRPA
jgi:preprotein translocase subunit SecG